MASKSYPRSAYNSGAITELEHERLTHPQAPDGLIGHPDDTPMVFADGSGTRVVKIRANRFGLVRGTLYDSGSSDISMASLAANSSGNPRIDRVVLRLSRSDYSVTETVIAGTPAGSPTAPALAQDVGSTGNFDIPLARIAVANGATTITSGNVTEEAYYLGENGILCRSATRPLSVVEGLFLTEVDTNKQYVGLDGSWRLLWEDTGWVSLSAASGWSAGPIRARRIGGIVYLQVNAERTGGALAGTASTLATLPAGYRPDSLGAYATSTINPGARQPALIVINSAGTVSLSLYESIATSGYVTGQTAFPASG